MKAKDHWCGMPLLPTVLPSTMQPGMPLPPWPMDSSLPLYTPFDCSFGTFGTTHGHIKQRGAQKIYI